MANELKCLIDTYAWTKLLFLIEGDWSELIEQVLKTNTLYITQEVKEEIEYRHPHQIKLLKYVTILSIIDIDFHSFNTIKLDKADASLISYSKKANLPVITEDHPMLALAVVDKLDFIQLIDYFLILNNLNQISNNQVQKLVRTLRRMKNITKRKSKQIIGKL